MALRISGWCVGAYSDRVELTLRLGAITETVTETNSAISVKTSEKTSETTTSGSLLKARSLMTVLSGLVLTSATGIQRFGADDEKLPHLLTQGHPHQGCSALFRGFPRKAEHNPVKVKKNN